MSVNDSCRDNLVAWVDIIGYTAGILVMSSSIPQIMKDLQDQKDVRCVYLFDESYSKWIISMGYLWPH